VNESIKSPPEIAELARRAKEEFLLRAQAHDDLIAYTQYTLPGYDAQPHHRIMAEALMRVEAGLCTNLIIEMGPRQGKMCADEIPVATPTGWTTHGDLTVGDEVFGPDGISTKIIAVSAKTKASICVKLTNGEVIYCHPNHEWTVRSESDWQWKTIATRNWLGRKLNNGKVGTRGGGYYYHLPTVSALQFAEADLQCDPYVLGAWLGDGSKGKACITHDPTDCEVVESFEQRGYAVSAQCAHADTGVFTTYFSGPRPNVSGRLTLELQGIEVYQEKFIPEAYKISSVQQRLQLLAGLIDTDGHVDCNGRTSVSTASRVLSEDIYEVATSLGFRPYVVETQPRLSSSGIQGKKVMYAVGFQPTMDIPTVIPRKKIARIAKQRCVSIESVEDVGGSRQGHCIQVERPDGMYVVGKKLIATHNSELVSRRFPAWAIGRNPKIEIIHTTYDQGLSRGFGRSIRNQVRSPEYQNIFLGVELSADATAVDAWETNEGGIYNATSIDGAVTGFGAHILLIDDPIKGWEEAQSTAVRDGAWDRYTADYITRLNPYKGTSGCIVLVATRWHENDLTGRILEEAEEAGEEWEVISFPSLAKHGDPLGRPFDTSLWPSKFPTERLKRLRKLQGRKFNALHQCDPIPPEGDTFKIDWFRRYDTLPTNLRRYGFSDYATKRNQGDFTVHMLIGIDESSHWYIIDVWRRQELSNKWIDAMLNIVHAQKLMGYGIRTWYEERGQIIGAVGPFLERRMRERKIFVTREQITSKRDKEERAIAFQARVQSGMVHIPVDAPWVGEFLKEIGKFPNGKNDDQVDCGSMCGNVMDKLDPAKGASEVDDEDEWVIKPAMPTFNDLMRNQEMARRGIPFTREAMVIDYNSALMGGDINVADKLSEIDKPSE